MNNLILKPIKGGQKTYNVFCKAESRLIGKELKNLFEMFMPDGGNRLVCLTKEKTFVDIFSGIVIFYNVPRLKDVTERFEKFKDKSHFFSCVSKAPSLEEQDIKHKKFGNSVVQDKILTSLGLDASKKHKYYCSISYMSSQYRFNVIAIDDALKANYPSEYKDNMSMSQFITTHFGKDTSNLFKEYF